MTEKINVYEKKTEIYHHGNTLQSIWHIFVTSNGILKMIFNIFNPIIARITSEKTNNPCGFIIYAKK
ncbi:hypothetical protein JW758_03985 [Candidatus Peregrinibacteria bacterium]|nr:hypothetical protein [Candidatus Peregrinibacteria bacterium]